METAQLNVRIPATLKAQGDRVLAEAGVSASELVRSLWEHLAIFCTVPEFGKKPKPANDGAYTRTRQGSTAEAASQSADDDLITCGSAMVQAFFAQNGLQWETQARSAYEGLREDMYAQELLEYEALNA